jgi:hypothetical protein
MEGYKKRRLDSLEPMLGSLEEESSLDSHDSRDAEDFQVDLLYDSDDDSEYQPPEDELTLEEEDRLENSEPFPSQEIMKLHAARHELGHVLIDDSHSSKEDSTVDTGDATSEKHLSPPV